MANEPSGEITAEEVMRALGEGFRTLATKHPDKNLSGWTTVEALARCTGIAIRTNAQRGQAETVMQGAVEEMARGFISDPSDLFIPGVES